MESQTVTISMGDIEAAGWLAKRAELEGRGKAISRVADDAELEIAGKFEADCKKLVKALAAIRLNLTRPLDEAKKWICEKEKELAAPLVREQRRVNALTTAYANELARRVEEERLAAEAAECAAAEAALAAEQADAAFGLGGAAAPAATPAVPKPVVTTARPHTSANRFVEKWSFAVTAPNAVPRELCSPDEAKIRAFMAAKKAEGYKAAQIVVAGISFSSSMQVYSR